jgi:3-deoxy-D-manno-octulosonate 8-phosphate phosphatase (KDO 8-P phosphatase)
LEHVCKQHKVTPDEVLFVFDDILDLDVAAQVGVRMMVSRRANPMVIKYATDRNLADYLTACDSSNHALREVTEMLIGLTGKYDETLDDRISYNEHYRKYITTRNTIPTEYYTVDGDNIIARKP